MICPQQNVNIVAIYIMQRLTFFNDISPTKCKYSCDLHHAKKVKHVG